MNSNIRPGLPELPSRIRNLPVEERGFPVPWFVAWIDGKPDFRVIDFGKIVLAIRERRCWVCGKTLGVYLAFVIGPMCAINRTSSEPPSHLECAEFACRACPFLTMPKMRRRENNLPEDARWSQTGIKRNPGVVLIWVTKSYRVFTGMGNEILIRIGDPFKTRWFCEGRPATREEVLESVNSGLPLLREAAEQDGPEAITLLEKLCEQASLLYPGSEESVNE